MNGLFEMEGYLPDRPPTWVEVFLLVVVSPSFALFSQWYSPLSLPAVGLGFVAVVVLVGPVSQTRHGKRVEKWEPNLGIVQRAGLSIILVLFAIGLISVFSKALFFGFLFGGNLAGALGLAVHVLRDRQIEELTPPEW